MARPVTTLNRWEQIASKPWAVNSVVRYTKQADFDPSRVLRSLLIHVKGTCTLATNPATAVRGDNVGAIIEQIRIFGKNQLRGSTDNFRQMRGCDLKELGNMGYGVTIFDASSTLATADAAYALDFFIVIDFPPQRVRVEEKVGYLLDVPNFTQLELDIQFGDEKSLWDLGTAVPTWSLQTVNLLGRYAQEPGKFAGFGFGLVYQTFVEIMGSPLTTTAQKVNLYQLDNKGLIRSLLLKTGVKATTATAGNNAYDSLSDTILANLGILQVPSQFFRSYFAFRELKAINACGQHRSPALGYALLDLTGDELLYDALAPKKIATGQAGDTNIWFQADVAGAANQGLVIAQESLYYADRVVIPQH
jgi:hypothetical protein